MNWNTWLRFKMRAIFEYSVRARDPSRTRRAAHASSFSSHTPPQVRAHWSELQGMAWYA